MRGKILVLFLIFPVVLTGKGRVYSFKDTKSIAPNPTSSQISQPFTNFGPQPSTSQVHNLLTSPTVLNTPFQNLPNVPNVPNVQPPKKIFGEFVFDQNGNLEGTGDKKNLFDEYGPFGPYYNLGSKNNWRTLPKKKGTAFMASDVMADLGVSPLKPDDAASGGFPKKRYIPTRYHFFSKLAMLVLHFLSYFQ